MLDIEGVRRLVFVVIVFAVLGFLTRLGLKPYSLELVHIVVVNAVAQKAPDDYPKSEVYETFSVCLEQVEKKQNRDHYMQQLLTLSHRLEKVQYLEREDVDALLGDLECN
jgi:hypothetical protein